MAAIRSERYFTGIYKQTREKGWNSTEFNFTDGILRF